MVLAASLVLSDTGIAHSLLQVPAVQGTEAAEETPGCGVSGYFSLEGEGASAIRVVPRSPAAGPGLDIQLQGRRFRVTSPQAEGGMLALQLMDARGRVVRAWNETLPPGGAAILALDGTTRGLLILVVDGGALGKAVKMVPPLRAGAW